MLPTVVDCTVVNTIMGTKNVKAFCPGK